MKGIEIARNDHCIRLPPACVLNRLTGKSRQLVFATGIGRLFIALLIGVTIGVFWGFFFNIAAGAFIGAMIAYIVLELSHRSPPRSLVGDLYHKKEDQC